MSMITKVSNIALNGTKQLNSLLLFGASGTGKTSIATYFAKNSKFTYVKILVRNLFTMIYFILGLTGYYFNPIMWIL